MVKGAIIKKKLKNLGIIPQWGGGNFFSKQSQFQFGKFAHPGGGSQFFKNVPISIILQLFCNITFIKNVGKSKISEFDPRGGVSNFQKCLKFKKV